MRRISWSNHGEKSHRRPLCKKRREEKGKPVNGKVVSEPGVLRRVYGYILRLCRPKRNILVLHSMEKEKR